MSLSDAFAGIRESRMEEAQVPKRLGAQAPKLPGAQEPKLPGAQEPKLPGAQAPRPLSTQAPKRLSTQAPKRLSAEAPKRLSAEAPKPAGSIGPRVPLPLQKSGKSSHPDFEPVKIYVRKETRRAAWRKWEDAQGGDFSDLVQQLLEEYLGA